MDKELEKGICVRGLIYSRHNILGVVWRGRVKLRKTSVIIINVPVEVRTEHLPNIIQKCCNLHPTNSFCILETNCNASRVLILKQLISNKQVKKIVIPRFIQWSICVLTRGELNHWVRFRGFRLTQHCFYCCFYFIQLLKQYCVRRKPLNQI
jgi:hypothetical protein